GAGAGDHGAGLRMADRRRQPGRRGPHRRVERADRARVPEFERGRGRSVVLPPGEPLAQPDPVLVPHGGRGLVPHPPAGRGQPPAGTQSESRKATSAVAATARPVFLAAAGPPLTGPRTTLAPAPSAALWIAAGSAEPSSTTITRGVPASPARQRASSACRSRT